MADPAFHYTAVVGAADWPAQCAGGKANGLHTLTRQGFAVPPAFCVLTSAFDDAVGRCVPEAGDLGQLGELLADVELPEALIAEISARMDAVGPGRWAVRSSALDEDMLAHSFAGQQQTVLGVDGVDQVVDAMRRVWASLYDIRGLLYRNQLDLDLVPQPMAVVVQRMISPTTAGVMFTQNPVSGADAEVVVNAAPGGAESVVDGGAADTYFLDKSTGYLERFEAGPTHGQPDRASSAGAEAGVPSETSRAILEADQLQELAQCARRLDQIFEHPQDVEWAYAPHSQAEADSGIQGTLFVLQSRPITTSETSCEPPAVWTNVNVGEALPGVATPLTWSIIRNFSRRGFEQAFGSLGLSVPDDYELVGSFRGRVYLNLSQFMSVASAIPLLSPTTLFEMAGGGGVELVRDIYEDHSPWEFLAKLPLTAARVLASQVSMPLVAPVWDKYLAYRRERFFGRDLRQLNHLAFRRQLDAIDALFDRTGLMMLACSSNFLMTFVVLRQWLALWAGPEAAGRETDLVSAVDVDSAQPGLDLLNLGRLARRSRRLRRVITESEPADTLANLQELAGHEDVDVFLDELAAFQGKHGHRAAREAELATPRWREDTQFLFEVVQTYLRGANLPRPRQLARERDQTRRRADQLVDRTFPVGVEAPFRAWLKYTRTNVRLREFMRARVVDTLDMYRRFFLECGRRLVLQDALNEADDVFYLRYDELRRWLDDVSTAGDFGMRVLVRRALHQACDQMADPPNTFVLDGPEMVDERDYRARHSAHEDPPDTGGAQADEILGLPGSRGRVTGRARIIDDPNDQADLQPGDILVASSTDVGWTPLFLTASAVVTDLGGPLSHSCIVAREYGIPTVVNAHGATDRIADGARITVDGDRGVVYLRRDDRSGET